MNHSAVHSIHWLDAVNRSYMNYCQAMRRLRPGRMKHAYRDRPYNFDHHSILTKSTAIWPKPQRLMHPQQCRWSWPFAPQLRSLFGHGQPLVVRRDCRAFQAAARDSMVARLRIPVRFLVHHIATLLSLCRTDLVAKTVYFHTVHCVGAWKYNRLMINDLVAAEWNEMQYETKQKDKRYRWSLLVWSTMLLSISVVLVRWECVVSGIGTVVMRCVLVDDGHVVSDFVTVGVDWLCVLTDVLVP